MKGVTFTKLNILNTEKGPVYKGIKNGETGLKKFEGQRRTRKTKQNNYKRKQTRFRRKHPSADQSKSQVSGQ